MNKNLDFQIQMRYPLNFPPAADFPVLRVYPHQRLIGDSDIDVHNFRDFSS